ncbi:acid-sensing ion channel 1A-like [Haliotis rufescens]|uniref:acid-sensing ion channel 1A-like n=1 Tax=Haliotis rufescens TaxID=6454 RepID=UPI00201F2ED0|nr:acid-sensing ion channel 1A-like [Haliotis rufescens]
MVKVTEPALQYLAHNIGISGFKYLLGPDATTARRLTWLLVIIAAVCWMVWNIHGRLVYYLTYPTSLDTQIHYQDAVEFPKITICNQNTFRSTQVFNETDGSQKSPTLYEALNQYHRVRSGNKKLNQLSDKYDDLLSSAGSLDFLKKMAHKKETLLKGCKWKRLPCGPANFSTVMTDLGVCFQFKADDKETPLQVDTSGHQSGLSLSLMVEQYDYMGESRDSAGAVVVISAPDETEAFADSTGFGVTVGFSTAIGLKKTRVHDMQAPYGTCGKTTLHEFPEDTEYTPLRCRLNCLTSHIREKCDCVELYMPNKHGRPYCSLLKQLQCVDRTKRTFFSSGMTKHCDCPFPCQSEHFSKILSQTAISRQYANRLSLADEAMSELTPSSHEQPSLTDVNEALKVQIWGLLNDLDPAYTDLLAVMADNVRQQRRRLVDLERSLVTFSENAATLFSNASVEGVVNDPDEKLTPMMYAHSITNYLKEVPGRLIKGSHNVSFWPTNVLNWGLETTLANDAVQEPKLQFKRIELMRGVVQVYFKQIRKHLEDVNSWVQTINKQSRDGSSTPNTLGGMSLSQMHYNDVVGYMRKMLRLIQTLGTYMVQFKNMPSVTHLVHLQQPLYTFLQPSFYQDNVLNVNIYFEDLSVEERVKSEAYSVEGLVCDIGGSIGLCLGGSILTLIEVVDLILFSRKRKKADSDTMPGTNMEGLPQKQALSVI